MYQARTKLFSGPNGNRRLFTLVLGAIDLGLTAECYYSGVRSETFFFETISVLLSITALFTISAIFGLQDKLAIFRKAEDIFHGIGGLVLLVASGVMLISVIKYANWNSTPNYVVRFSSALIGILNALAYGSQSWNSFTIPDIFSG